MQIVAEEWRPIPGVPDYEASRRGEIRSTDRSIVCLRHGVPRSVHRMSRVLSQHIHKDYLSLVIRGTNYRAHRLIALAWLGEAESGMVVNHINGIKTDNRPENLEYVTSSENSLHSYRAGLQKPVRGESHGGAVLSEEMVRAIRVAPESVTHSELARRYGVDRVSIRQVRLRKTWAHVA